MRRRRGRRGNRYIILIRREIQDHVRREEENSANRKGNGNKVMGVKRKPVLTNERKE